MNKTRLTKLLACALVLMMAVAVFALPVLAQDAKTPDTGTGDPPATNTGSVQVVAYSLSPALTTITPDTTFDLIVKFSDSRPEVVAAAPNIKPVAINNSSGFIRSRDMTSYDGYPDFQLVSDSTTEKYITPEDGQVVYTLLFPLKYTGNGSEFTIDLSYENLDTVALQKISFTLSTTVDRAESDSQANAIGTGFVVTSANYGGSEVTAGTPFTLSAALMATSGSYNVENTSVTLILPKEIKFNTGSSIQYIGTVKPGQSVSAQFELLPNATAEEGSYVITIKVTGTNPKDGSAVEASADITVPVTQPERFEISNARLPEYLVAGMNDGSGYSSVDLVNKGKGAVYNVEVEITGDGLSAEEGKQFVGTINGGSQSSVDFTVLADMGGTLQGTLVISYENARGEQKSLTQGFTVTADDMGGDMGIDPWEPMPTPEPEPESTGMPVWAWLLIIVGGVAVAVVVLVVVLKKRKAKKAAELEAGLDDDLD